LVFPPYEDRRPEIEEGEGGLPEIHLYFGSFCNRSCDFCVVFGSPKGWVVKVDEALLETLLDVLHPRAQIKIYGGEPTLLADNLIWAFRFLRERGFAGRLVLFSNGVQADRLIRMLEADERSCCVLNYSILTGTHADPIPPAALRQLTAYEQEHPGRIFVGHADLVEVGRAITWDHEALLAREDFENNCPRCYPTVTTRGQYHACPFAVENPSAQYRLGNLQTPPEEVQRRFQRFLHWIDAVVLPTARDQGRHPCAVCTTAEGQLAMPEHAEEEGCSEKRPKPVLST